MIIPQKWFVSLTMVGVEGYYSYECALYSEHWPTHFIDNKYCSILVKFGLCASAKFKLLLTKVILITYEYYCLRFITKL
jgi:hypothetical protein